MRINPFALALQIISAVDAAGSLQPGEKEAMPIIHITDKGKHLDIAITVSRDASKATSDTHLPDSKG